MEKIKSLWWFFITGIISIISDYQHAFVALFVGFVFNFIIGIGADANNGSKTFSMKKATEGMKLLMFYCLTVFALYGMTYKDEMMTATAIKWLTYIVSYFYLVNIFRNAGKIFPNSKSIAFIYLFLSTEVFYKLKDMLGIKRKETEEEQ